MLKRKISQPYYNNNNNNNNTYDIVYENLKNCDSIKKKDNSIYFNSIISHETINKLIEFIEIIISNKNASVDLYITSKGGYINSLNTFLDYKKMKLNLYIRSIIINECNDCALLLASCCNYRIITKNSICNISPYNNLYYQNYWGYFKQYDDNTINIKDLLIELFTKQNKSKITSENLMIYFQNSRINTLNSKKCKKLGFIDEIV